MSLVDLCVYIYHLFFLHCSERAVRFFSTTFHVFFQYWIYKISKFFKSIWFFSESFIHFQFRKKCLMDTSIKPKSMSREYRLIDFYWNNWIRIEMMLTITNTTLLTHTHTLNFDVFCPLVFLVKQSYENSIECEFNENRNTNYPILITIRGFCSFYNMPFPNEIYQRFFSSSNFDPIFMPTK